MTNLKSSAEKVKVFWKKFFIFLTISKGIFYGCLTEG